MKTPRILAAAIAATVVATAAVAAAPSPTGTWKWSVSTPNGDIETTLKLELKDGQLTGTYSNSFGDTAISKGSVKDDAISFEVVRDFNGTQFVLKYQGKLTADAIKGTITVPGQDGGEGRQIDWNAKRVPEAAKS
jgi:hypothetical protein